MVSCFFFLKCNRIIKVICRNFTLPVRFSKMGLKADILSHSLLSPTGAELQELSFRVSCSDWCRWALPSFPGCHQHMLKIHTHSQGSQNIDKFLFRASRSLEERGRILIFMAKQCSCFLTTLLLSSSLRVRNQSQRCWVTNPRSCSLYAELGFKPRVSRLTA